jgi:hypothetical protein
MRVWVTWVASASIIEEEARVCLGMLRERCQSILKRRAGVMIYANSWIQHFNPACRVARQFPHLPLSRLLMSLSDFDLPINYSVSTSSAWFQKEKYAYFSVFLLWPSCPLLVQDMINETIATVALCAIIFIIPRITGFIVRKENLDQFFNEKLSLINFNQKEIKDFKEYWVSYLSQKDSDYFRITFFQNNIVNKLFPMSISPKPSSSIRMFMDWDYASKETIIPEQNLISYPRVGFTLIEWGGLKQ